MPIPFNLWSTVSAFPILSTLTLIPLLTAAAVLRSLEHRAMPIALSGATLNVALSIYLLHLFDTLQPGIHLAEHHTLFGLEYRVGVDGTNLLFIPLTTILSLLTLIYTMITRHQEPRRFMASLLAYQAILIGAFVALNALQFWLWCLLEPMILALLTLSAGQNPMRKKAVSYVVKAWLSSLAMSLAGFMLLGYGLWASGHGFGFDWLTLKQHSGELPNQTLIFVLLLFGFAIRMPLFPFHAWLPLLAEHGTAASAAIHLTGLKLGIYAALRFILPLTPVAADHWANFVMVLGLIGVFYGAILALMQINMRRLMAFAVISHTSLLVIGVFTLDDAALEGSIMLTLAYGLATAGMLFSIGLIYERTRTTYLPRLGDLFDGNTAIALLFLISALSTMVMPGTAGFDAAHLLIKGIIEEHSWLIAIAVLAGNNLLAAGFLLLTFQRVFIAQSRRFRQPYASQHHPVGLERLIAVTLVALLIGTGFYTTPWLRYIGQAAIEIGENYPDHLHPRPSPSTSPSQPGPVHD